MNAVFQVCGRHGSTSRPPNSRRAPRIHSVAAMNIHGVVPVFQVNAPSPNRCRDPGPTTYSAQTYGSTLYRSWSCLAGLIGRSLAYVSYALSPRLMTQSATTLKAQAWEKTAAFSFVPSANAVTRPIAGLNDV